MIALIESEHIWLPPLPPDPRTPRFTPGVRPNSIPMSTPDPALPVAAWAAQKLNFHADPIQAQILNTHTNRLLLCCTRQWGKSSLAAIKALHFAASHPGAFVLFAAPSFKQSAELLRAFRKYAARLTGKLAASSNGATVLHNGSRILALPQSPATVRCYSAANIIVVDEAAFVEDEMFDALSPMLATTNGQLWMLSSANSTSGEFYRQWRQSSPEWHKFTVTANHCPRISPAFLAAEKRAKGEAIFNREYLCQFTANAAKGINETFIDAAFRGDFPAQQIPGK